MGRINSIIYQHRVLEYDSSSSDINQMCGCLIEQSIIEKCSFLTVYKIKTSAWDLHW